MTGNGLCIGDEAPDFTLRDQFGQDVRLSDFRGRKAVVLMFFPFAFTGALGLSILTDSPVGIPSMIGMLMLIGIVVTNAITVWPAMPVKRHQSWSSPLCRLPCSS